MRIILGSQRTMLHTIHSLHPMSGLRHTSILDGIIIAFRRAKHNICVIRPKVVDLEHRFRQDAHTAVANMFVATNCMFCLRLPKQEGCKEDAW